MLNPYRSNLNKYVLFRTFADLIILGPIIMIFLYAKGLTFAEIMLLNSIFSVAVFLLEVPTGMLADKISRKYSLVIGSLCWTIQLVIFIYGNSFFAFLIAELFCALGVTFKSGAGTALLYDSLKTMKREDEVQKYEGFAYSILLYSQAIGSIAAGFLFIINIHLPLVISAINTTISAIVATQFKEPPIEDKREKESYFTHIKDSSTYILKHGKVKAIIAYGAIFNIFYRVGFFFFQPYFEGVNVDVIYFGFFFALFNVVAGLSSQNAHSIMKFTKGKTLTMLSLLLIVSFGIMSVTTIWIGAFAILLQQVARGLYAPIMSKYINKHIPSNKRATIMSLYSLVASLAAAAFYPIFGWIMDNSNVFFTHGILTVSMIVLTIASLTYYGVTVSRHRAEEEIREMVKKEDFIPFPFLEDVFKFAQSPISLMKSTIDDSETLYNMQREVFAPLYEKYQDHETSPVNQPKDRFLRRFEIGDYYKIYYSNQLAGSVFVFKKEPGVMKLHIMNILQKYQNKGIAQETMNRLELIYPEAKRWELETILTEERNCYLYEKLGYKRTEDLQVINEKLTIVTYVKEEGIQRLPGLF